MCKVDPGLYRKFIQNNSKGKPVLYVMIYKVLYSPLRSALLFYCRLVSELEDYGFKLNSYNQCVATMDANGTQMTGV